MKHNNTIPHSLELRAGEIVEVRSRNEILSTLDDKGTLDALPFMPEMLRYCGQRYKVHKRADKTCDTITEEHKIRRMFNTVHLDGVRCDGEHHGGCEATCPLFWKEAWLKRADGTSSGYIRNGRVEINGSDGRACTVETLIGSTKKSQDTGSPDLDRYSCQATELLNATTELKWWDIRQYVRDIRSGNICFGHFMRWIIVAWINWAHMKFRGWRRYPFIDSRLLQRKNTPVESLDLQPGEYVQIKSLEEILYTLDRRAKNRGLLFDKEMIRYCGKTAKVLKRVNKIINEANGEMIQMNKETVILEGVVCTGSVSENRLFCPRGVYPFWREIWLRRIEK